VASSEPRIRQASRAMEGPTVESRAPPVHILRSPSLSKERALGVTTGVADHIDLLESLPRPSEQSKFNDLYAWV
jgi:hypothetical protein